MRILYVLIGIVLTGCGGTTLQVKEGENWRDVSRIVGQGSFTVEYATDGKIAKLSGDTRRPSMLDRTVDAAAKVFVIDRLGQ